MGHIIASLYMGATIQKKTKQIANIRMDPRSFILFYFIAHERQTRKNASKHM